nr:hypothetical protein [uncultured Haemophilus sp.]
MNIEQIQQKYATRIEQLKREYATRLESYKNTSQGKHWLEAIKNNDKHLVRSMLKTELTDASVSSDELLFLITLVAKEMPDSLEPYNVSKFYEAIKYDDSEQIDWNKDYFLKQQSYLTLNFFVARFIHLVDVKSYINPTLKAEQKLPNQPEKSDGILEKIRKLASDIVGFSKENPKKTAIAVLIVVGLVLFW